MSALRCECCDFKWESEKEKDEHVTYMQSCGLFEEARRVTQQGEKGIGCEYGCPYGSEEHEWRLLEWERTGRW